MVDGPERMLLPPESADGSAPYDAPRGRCPACGSGDVSHLVIGMPAHLEDLDSGPEWLRWVGCVHPGFERECSACWTKWSVEDGQLFVQVPKEHH